MSTRLARAVLVCTSCVLAVSLVSLPIGARTQTPAQTPLPSTSNSPQFNLTPTRLVIPSGQSSTSLVLKNEGAETLRFQISASAWRNDVDGQLVLQSTSDVAFFPVLFVVEPGQSRRIRVAVTSRAIERELSYRLVVEQLPSRSGTQASGVQMLMRASLPLFVQPPTMVARATVDHAGVAGGRLSFEVHNIGTVHVSIERVTVRAARGAAAPFESQLAGWYLLSGETRAYHLALPADLCRERPTLTIAVKFVDNAQPLTIEQPVADGVCAP